MLIRDFDHFITNYKKIRLFNAVGLLILSDQEQYLSQFLFFFFFIFFLKKKIAIGIYIYTRVCQKYIRITHKRDPWRIWTWLKIYIFFYKFYLYLKSFYKEVTNYYHFLIFTRFSKRAHGIVKRDF